MSVGTVRFLKFIGVLTLLALAVGLLEPWFRSVVLGGYTDTLGPGMTLVAVIIYPAVVIFGITKALNALTGWHG